MKGKNIIQYGIQKPKKRDKKKSKYPFALMRVGGSFFIETSPQNLLTSFKAWCSRNSKPWRAQCWTSEEIPEGGKLKVKGARIKRVK